MALDCQSKQTAKVATATAGAATVEGSKEQNTKFNLSSSQCSSQFSQVNPTQTLSRNMENLSDNNFLKTPSSSSSTSVESLNQNIFFSKSNTLSSNNEEKSLNLSDVKSRIPTLVPSSSISGSTPCYYSGSLNIHSSNSNSHPSLKLTIPINSNSSNTPNNINLSSSPSTSSTFESSPPNSTTYTELTPLPSPLVPTDSTSAIFKAYNGQSPPTTTISRAPSLRNSGLRFNLHSTINNNSKNTHSPINAPRKGFEDDCSILPLPLTSNKYASLSSNDTIFSPDSSTIKSNSASQGISNHLNLQPSMIPTEGSKNTALFSKVSSMKTSSRSVSEYVPQPITPSSLASYHRRSPKPTTSRNIEEEYLSESKTKNEHNSKVQINENNYSSHFSTHITPNNEIKNQKLRNAPAVINPICVPGILEETPSLKVGGQTPSSETLAENNSQEESLRLNLQKDTSSISVNQTLGKVQPRSSSSGSPVFGRTIQREKPIIASKSEPPFGAALAPPLPTSTSTMQTSPSPSSSSITINTSTNPQIKLCSQSLNSSLDQNKAPLATELLDVTNLISMGDQSSNISQHHPKQEKEKETKQYYEKQKVLSQLKPISTDQEKVPSLQNPLELTSSTVTTSTSSGSIIGSISNATASSTITSVSADTSDKFYSTRVYEAYDTNMKKSTWNEIKQLGRGAFSKVILACPADRYLKPEYQGHSREYQVAIKVVDIQIEGGHVHSRERMESGLKREIEILKVSCVFFLFILEITNTLIFRQ